MNVKLILWPSTITSADKNEDPRSEQEKTKGNLEYSSIMVSINWLLVFVGTGHLKSILKRSNGSVALITFERVDLRF